MVIFLLFPAMILTVPLVLWGACLVSPGILLTPPWWLLRVSRFLPGQDALGSWCILPTLDLAMLSDTGVWGGGGKTGLMLGMLAVACPAWKVRRLQGGTEGLSHFGHL